MRDEEFFPTRAADAEVELEYIVQACDDDEDDYVTTDEGVLLFFERLHHGWKLGHDGKLHPPKAPNLADLNLNAHIDGSAVHTESHKEL